jgi:tRNA (Thr-GGU) A37 N-methylase
MMEQVGPLVVIGLVDSTLTDIADAPRQPDEPGTATARLIIEAAYRDGIHGIGVGDEIIVLTWLHVANHDTLVVHPVATQPDQRTACSPPAHNTARTRSDTTTPQSPPSHPTA